MTPSDGPALAFGRGPLLQGKGQAGAGDPEGLSVLWGWMRLSADVSSGSPDPTRHPLAPGIVAFQLVPGSGPSPELTKSRRTARRVFTLHHVPPRHVPASGVPQRSALAISHRRLVFVSSSSLARRAVPPEEEEVYLGALVSTCGPRPPARCWRGPGPEGAAPLTGLRPPSLQFSPAPQHRRAGAGPMGFSWGSGSRAGVTP